MMAFYHAKQEEMKKLETEDTGDQYMNSVWADNKAMKGQLHGIGNIQMGKGIRM